MQKLYAYVDESGQDTKGALFVVGVVVTEEERSVLQRELETIEKTSGKENVKWHKTRPDARAAYLEAVVRSPSFKRKLFFEIFTNTVQYLEMTAYATAKAIHMCAESLYVATIFIDGLKKPERGRFEVALRELRVRKRKVRGVRREENDAFIRLADALCGLVRDAHDGNQWAKETLERLKKRGVVTAL